MSVRLVDFSRGAPEEGTGWSSCRRGRQTLHSHPERLAEVNNEIDGFGCTVVSQYALLGPYDFRTIVEAPDNETVAHLSVDLSSRGTVHITTLPAIPVDSFVEKLGDRKQLGHR